MYDIFLVEVVNPKACLVEVDESLIFRQLPAFSEVVEKRTIF